MMIEYSECEHIVIENEIKCYRVEVVCFILCAILARCSLLRPCTPIVFFSFSLSKLFSYIFYPLASSLWSLLFLSDTVYAENKNPLWRGILFVWIFWDYPCRVYSECIFYVLLQIVPVHKGILYISVESVVEILRHLLDRDALWILPLC